MRWALPDRVFFACGACHILAYAFLERNWTAGGRAVWIRPLDGFAGHHVFVAGPGWAFDYHGFCDPDRLLHHSFRKAGRWWPGWNATLVPLPTNVLISEERSRAYGGLRLREPQQFLFDALPRARAYLDRFPRPQGHEGAAPKPYADDVMWTERAIRFSCREMTESAAPLA